MDKAEKSESMAADFEGSHFPTLYVSHANNVGRGEGVGAVRNFCNITYDDFFLFAVVDEKAKAYFGPPQGGMYICNACGSTQKSQSNMICHIESKHLALNLKCVF